MTWHRRKHLHPDPFLLFVPPESFLSGAVSDGGSVSPSAGLCLNCWSLQELVSRDASNYLILVEKILGKAKEVSRGAAR